MERARHILTELLHPPVWVLLTVPPLSFAALIAVFVCSETDHALTYLIYSLSAYSLAVWAAAVPGLARRAKAAVKGSWLAQRAAASPVAGGCVYGIVIILAVSMLLRSRAPEKKVNHIEPL